MKKLLSILSIIAVCFSLVGCTQAPKEEEGKKLVVSATLDPHSRILEFAKPILKDQYGIELEILVLDDYYVFNAALNDGEVDANFFQHIPFFNEELKKGYDIVNIAGIHIEPFGFYSKTVTNIDDLKEGAKVIISNSVADHGRILAILQEAGLIKLNDGVDSLNATIEDIVENRLNLQFEEIKPEILNLAYENNEGDLIAINGNYAIQAGLNPTKDAIILEKANAENPYVNIVAIKKGNEEKDTIKALVEVLKGDAVKQFILDTYNDGSVIPAE